MQTEAPQASSPAFYTISDLMSRWKVCRATIYRLIDLGRLRRRHIGGQVRFAAEDVRAFEEQAD